MKTKFFLLFLVACAGVNFDTIAQTPDELIQTWYLYYTEADLGESPTNYYGENVPQLTFYTDGTYNGIDNCWAINGDYNYVEDVNGFQGLLMGESDSECILGGSTAFTLVELINFDELTIISLDLGQLILEEAPGFIYEFRNEVTLSSEEFSNTDLKISPNPTEGSIEIDYAGHIDKVEIYDSNGRLLVRKYNNYRLMNIDNLKNGVYFVKIKGDLGIVTRKIIKK